LGNGVGTDATFTYYYCSPGGSGSGCYDFGVGVPLQQWSFNATAQSAETVTATYLWTGSHSLVNAEAGLTAFTDLDGSVVTTPIVGYGTVSNPFSFTNNYSFGPLSAGESYGFYISGSNYDEYSFLQGTFTFETQDAPPPAAPTGLTATSGVGTVGLSWTAPAAGGNYSSATGYEVLAGSTPGEESLDANATVSGTTASVLALPNGSAFAGGDTYYFTVVATDSYGAGQPSGEATATPASPDIWSATGPGAIAPLGNGQTGEPSFNYFYCSEPGGTPTSCTDGGASATWTFSATAANGEGSVAAAYNWNGFHAYFEATASLSAFITVPGGTPVITPLFSAAPQTCPPCTPPSAGFDYTGTYTFSGLAPADTYGFTLSGSNEDSNAQLSGTFTYETLGGPPPATPVNVAATSVASAVDLSWVQPTTSQTSGAGYGPATSYQVFEGPSAGSEVLDPNATITGTSAVVSTDASGSALSPGSTYYFTVVAVNAYDPSAPSLEVSAQPAAAEPADTSWQDAQTLSGSTQGTIADAGEDLWYEFPVQPGQQVQVSLATVAADYDISLFSDINQTFQSETSSTPNLAELGAESPGNAASPSAFSPSAFSPSAFSPSAFSPSAFSPSAFSPSAFSPSAFSPSAFSPSAFSPSAFSAAYSDAQIDSLMAVSTAQGAVNKSVTADTWNNTGNFYVRISGNNGASSPVPFTISETTSGGACQGVTLSSFTGDGYATTSGGTISGAGGSPYQTVIVDDSALMPAAGSVYSGPSALYTPLHKLATATNGVVVDVGQSVWVNDLEAQAQANPTCPYAENLVAEAIQSIINTYRVNAANLQDVIIVGDDDVIPFFRYPDNAGLAPEADYEPPLSSITAADAALQGNYYLSDDQYGADIQLNIQGTTVPLETAAVGRLVETPTDILATVNSYLGGATVIKPTSSLATGYDFMAAPASQILSAFSTGIRNGTNTPFITNDGVATSQTGAPPTNAWTASGLASTLFGSHHDLVFLGAHFSANNLLAADDTSTLTTNQFASQVGTSLAGSLVISAGCHAGYNIDGADAVKGVTDTLAWPQTFTEAGATLIAGTGYQYGDTDYVAYSDQVYVDVAQQLGYQPTAGASPVAVGNALLAAKQQYLSSLDQLNGVEEKALLEITLYGIPQLGVQEPNQIPAPGQTVSTVQASAVTTNPGQTLGLEGADFKLTPTLTTQTDKPIGSSTTYTYDSGPQGIVADPGGPVLPVQTTNVNVAGETLRGVGFLGGVYTDVTGQSPLTGEPTTETGVTQLTPFASPVYFPQTVWNPNYFSTLLGGGGTTDLAVTPVQYESDPNSTATDTMRTYNNLDLHLFYSNNTQQYGSNLPALAAPPTISDVSSTTNGDLVTVSATVTGDPSAGIQEVWVTFTGTGPGAPLFGSWQSVDLTQSLTNSTQWSGTFTDTDALDDTGNPASDAQFMVQAVNGVGLVALNNNNGYYFTPTFTPGAPPSPTANTYSLVLGGATGGAYLGSASVTATLASTGGSTANISGQTITFGLGATTLSAVTNSSGVASAPLPVIEAPGGAYNLTASYAGDANDQPVATSEQFRVSTAMTALSLSAPRQITSGVDNGVTATLTASTVPLGQKPVYFEVTNNGGTVVGTGIGLTNSSGVAEAGAISVTPGDVGPGYSVTAYFGSSAVTLPSGTTYNASDPDYAASHSAPASVTVADSTQTSLTVSPSPSVTGQSVVLTATVISTNGDGSFTPPNAGSKVAFYEGKSAITACAAQAVTSGTAKCSVTSLTAGPYTFSANYSGSLPAYLASSSSPASLTVGAAATTTSVVSTTGLFSAVGQAVTYTATVAVGAPGLGTPGGKVEFLDNGVAFSACGGSAGVTLTGTKATCTVSYAAPGNHPISALYLGSTNYSASPASASVTQVVGATTTSLAAPASSPFGTPITLTATVKASAPASAPPTGMVTFYVGTGVVGTAALAVNKSGVDSASVLTWGLQGGTQSLSAVYSASPNFSTSTGTATDKVTFTQTISGTVTGNLVISAGQQVLLTGKVTGSVTVNAAGGLEVSGGSIGGPLTALAAVGLTLCGAKVGGALSATLGIGYVLIGGGPGCAASTVTGTASLVGNLAGVDVAASTFAAGLTMSYNLGYGPVQLSGVFPPTVIAANAVTGTLACTGNVPPPIDAGQPNRSTSRSGQCAPPTF
jgi:hypothetical protein